MLFVLLSLNISVNMHFFKGGNTAQDFFEASIINNDLNVPGLLSSNSIVKIVIFSLRIFYSKSCKYMHLELIIAIINK